MSIDGSAQTRSPAATSILSRKERSSAIPDEDQVQMLATAASIACTGLTGSHLTALQASPIPAGFSWERKAAAHAEFFNALADAGADPRLARALSSGAGLVYHLMLTAGCAADGIVINSRKWMLAHLHAGDAHAAAHEMESHLRVLHFMSRLAAPPAQRASA
jgi:DNA-binding FadR family transcriptional regulator